MFAFIKDGLMHYEERRNLPGAQGTSRLSAHLHFGHLSGVEMVKEILKTYPSTLSDDERVLKVSVPVFGACRQRSRVSRSNHYMA